MVKAYGILFALVGALLALPGMAHAQAVGSLCTLERAIDFVITQDNGDFVDLKLSAGEVLRVVGGDAESRRVLWGNYESVTALVILIDSCVCSKAKVRLLASFEIFRFKRIINFPFISRLMECRIPS